MQITVVDVCTVSKGDIDFSEISACGNARYYDVLTPEELIAATKDAEILLVNKAEVTSRLIDSCPYLKYVGTFSTGYNNLDLPALKKRGITCCNVPGYSTNAVCQHVFALLFMFEGNTDKYVNSVTNGDWIKSPTFCYLPWDMREVFGKTFGVYGYGAIGRAVARAAESFGMRVIVHTRTQPKDCPYPVVDKETIFKQSDYLTFHCPLNADTAGVINAGTLALMKRDAVIINTARGGLADECALKKALNEGVIRGYLADVLTKEPMRVDCPLYGAKNCCLTPHIAWGPTETRTRLVKIVAQNIRVWQHGTPQNVII